MGTSIIEKVRWYPSLKRASGAINMHSRGPTKPLKCKLRWYPHVLYYSAVKVEELCGTNSRFLSFSEKYCRAISV